MCDKDPGESVSVRLLVSSVLSTENNFRRQLAMSETSTAGLESMLMTMMSVSSGCWLSSSSLELKCFSVTDGVVDADS